MIKDDDHAFTALVNSTLKQMKDVATTVSSTSYEVHRSKGELTIQRSDKSWLDSDTSKLAD